MKVARQPKVSAVLRICAGTCALLWLVGIAVYGMGRVCNCAGHEGNCAAQASPVQEYDAVFAHEQRHSHDAEHHHDAEAHQHATASHDEDGEAPQGHCDKNGCEDKCCCSTIQALITTMTPVVIPKPFSQPVFNISLSWAPQHVFAAAPSETLRQAKPRDWVFTPEVCTDSANRPHAPPASV